MRPVAAHLRKERRELLQSMLGEFAVSGDLAAEDREHRRGVCWRVNVEDIISRNRARIGGLVVIKRPDAGKGIEHVVRCGCFLKIAVNHREEVFNLVIGNANIIRLPVEGNVGGADQSKVALIRIDEDDALIVMLKKVGLLSLPEFFRHNMTSFDETDTI